ncbi:MAG TPA: DMT family transporter [Kofleriaceae bacterium]|nr:DMT family transporter [Kofleriaceae bacterium]
MVRSAIARGVVLAALAAIAFGVTTPVVAWAGRGVGAFATAALLYAGAAAASAVMWALGRARADRPPPLGRRDAWRVLGVAIAGGAVAPALLAWGLQRAGATVGALLLNLEAVFTVVLARAVFHEPIGRRVALAVIAMVAGGAALVLDVSRGTAWSVAGVAAVSAATLGWAVDNTLTRPLAERDPLSVIAAKAGLGAAFTFTAAVIAGEPPPSPGAAVVLLACGATGYGVSLRLYLLAQRAIGAGRTGSVFALAPFLGAAIAMVAGERGATGWTAAAAALFATGVYLHLTEHHAHAHVHEPIEHDHVHRHDDGHHDHTHEPPVAGEHAHPHRHDRLAHSHDHGADLHHAHPH